MQVSVRVTLFDRPDRAPLGSSPAIAVHDESQQTHLV